MPVGIYKHPPQCGFQKGHNGFRRYIPRFCEIEGCNNKHHANGLCRKHYLQDNKEHTSEYFQQYRIDNKKKLNKYYKQWKKTPAGKISRKTHLHNRRALKKDLTKETVQRVYEDNIKKFGTLTCCLCFESVDFADSSLEHLTPLTREGTNDYDNLGIAHYICNIKKHTKTLDEWFAKTKIKQKETIL